MGQNIMKIFFPSSASALGACFGHSFLRMDPGFRAGQRLPQHKLCRCYQQGQPLLLLAVVEGGTLAGFPQLLGTGRTRPAGDPGQRGLPRRAREVDVGSGRLSLMQLPLCPCPDDELPRKEAERTTSPPCQLGKPHPSDARMCCIMLPRQLASYDAEAGGCGVMPHESRESSDLSVMGTDKEQRCACRGRLGHCCRDGCRGGGVALVQSPPSARIQSLVQPNLRDGGGRNLQGSRVWSILAVGLFRVKSAEGLHGASLGMGASGIPLLQCRDNPDWCRASPPEPAATAASLILRKSYWRILPRISQTSLDPSGFAALLGSDWTHLLWQTCSFTRLFAQGPFPNPECPRVPNNRHGAVLPKCDLFLLGCLAQGIALRGRI